MLGVQNVNRVKGCVRVTMGVAGEILSPGGEFDLSSPEDLHALGGASDANRFYWQELYVGNKVHYFGSNGQAWVEFDTLEEAKEFSGVDDIDHGDDEDGDDEPAPKKKKKKKGSRS